MMNPNEPVQVSGYPENPEREKRLDSMKILIDRHNFLVNQVSLLEAAFNEKDTKIKTFKDEFQEDLFEQKKLIEQTKSLITQVEQIKKTIGIDFKNIVKRPLFEKLEKRINGIEYENYVTRDELNRKFDNY